jgi:hypothetical protein
MCVQRSRLLTVQKRPLILLSERRQGPRTELPSAGRIRPVAGRYQRAQQAQAEAEAATATAVYLLGGHGAIIGAGLRDSLG